MQGERLERHNVFGEFDRYKSEREQLHWDGNFDEYIEKAVENPGIVRTSQQTAYSAVTSRPDFFTTGKNALFGAEKATERFIDILNAGAQGLELGRRIIILVGPPGSGKSTLVNGTKRGIEEYTKTDEGAVYAIKGCPMHEEPLHLIPKDLRPMLEEKYGLRIDGDLCPHCVAMHGGENQSSDALKNVEVERVFFSEKDRVGIGTFKPSDPKSQDITELTGSPDYSKIGEIGTASDARAFKFDGELNIANRGIMEFVEMLKSDEKFLYTLLDLAQDRVIKAPRFPNISADEVILAHTNMTEYNSYVQNPKNEALRDRMVVIPVPYTLRVSAERKIHEKLVGQSEQVRKSSVHINPRTLETAATFAVLSRLKESKKYSKLQKLKIYDGQETNDLTQRDIKELQEEHKDEGMSGISPRYVIDSLSTALIEGNKGCLTPIDAIRALRKNLEFHAHTRDMKKEDKDALKDDLTTVKEVFDEMAVKEVQSAFVYAYEDTARSLCGNYLNNVEAFCMRTKITDPITEDEFDPDEKLMRSIEEQIGISDNGKKEFRSELLMRMGSIYRQGGTFDHETHPRLKEAIEKKLFADMKDMVKLTTSSKLPNEEQKNRLQTVQDKLIEERGYCQHCSDELIRYVGTLLSR
jgi:serine protein kinase